MGPMAAWPNLHRFGNHTTAHQLCPLQQRACTSVSGRVCNAKPTATCRAQALRYQDNISCTTGSLIAGANQHLALLQRSTCSRFSARGVPLLARAVSEATTSAASDASEVGPWPGLHTSHSHWTEDYRGTQSISHPSLHLPGAGQQQEQGVAACCAS